MTDTGSTSTSPEALTVELTKMRDTARALASEQLGLASDAQRAIEIVEWSSGQGINQYPEVLSGELRKANSILVGDLFHITSARSSVQMVASATSSVAISHAIKTNPAVISIPPALNRMGRQTELDGLLDWASGTQDLSTRRRSAWVTIELATPEAAAQACHSMREVLTALLDSLAPNRAVQSAAWWKPAADTKDGVSKRQKVKYLMVCGTDRGLSETVLDQVDAQVDLAVDSHQSAISVAHHKASAGYAAARLALTSLEEVMETLLRFRRSLGNCSNAT